jgi:hypothetical protein
VAKEIELTCGRQRLDFEAFVFSFGKMDHADLVAEMVRTGADLKNIATLFVLY